MGDAGKQALTVHQLSVNARLHLFEGAGGAAQLGGADLGNRLRRARAAKGIGGRG
jgi:hypothetical protein